MIVPVRPYGIRGVIWYQGERNSKDVPQAIHYRKQLALLINYYRSSWHELSGGNTAKDFPFQFTQLPSWTAKQNKPVEGLAAPWVVNREMMRLVTQDVPNTSMAVAIDTGDAIALHPKNKKPIGIRHAYLALKQTYGRDFRRLRPALPRKQTVQGNTDHPRVRFRRRRYGARPRHGKLDAPSRLPAKTEGVALGGRRRSKATRSLFRPRGFPNPVAVRYAWSDESLAAQSAL